jgi:hypothetical protein
VQPRCPNAQRSTPGDDMGQGESQKHGVPQMTVSQDCVSVRTLEDKIREIEGNDENRGRQDTAEGDDSESPMRFFANSVREAYAEIGGALRKGRVQRRSSRSEATYRDQTGCLPSRSPGFDTLRYSTSACPERSRRARSPKHGHTPRQGLSAETHISPVAVWRDARRG